MTESNEKKALKLEAGKRYVKRNGWITPPLLLDDEFEQTYPFVCGTEEAMSWTPEGKFFSGDAEAGREDIDDLVADFVVDASIVPGVPEGWKLVRIGAAQVGEAIVSCCIDGFVIPVTSASSLNVPIAERIE